MKIKSRIKKIETTLNVVSVFCRCREQGREKKSIEAETFGELMEKLYQGNCAGCCKSHVPPGYNVGMAWIESAKGIDSVGLRLVNAELAASESFLKILKLKCCKNCGEPFENLTDDCKQGMTLPETCHFLSEKLSGERNNEH